MGADERLIETWDGKDYERHSSHQRQWGGGLIEELPLRGDERVLDLGCGDGTLTRSLADRVPRGVVLGVDAAPGMLEAARTKCGPNMAVRLLDLNALAFDGEFDVVFSNATLHWIHDHAPLLAHIHRALAPGGILRAQFGGDGNCPNFLECVRRQMAVPPFAQALAGFRWPWFFPGVSEYEALLSLSPFHEWRAWIEPKEQGFPTAEAIVGWIDNPCPDSLRPGAARGSPQAVPGRGRGDDARPHAPARRHAPRAVPPDQRLGQEDRLMDRRPWPEASRK